MYQSIVEDDSQYKIIRVIGSKLYFPFSLSPLIPSLVDCRLKFQSWQQESHKHRSEIYSAFSESPLKRFPAMIFPLASRINFEMKLLLSILLPLGFMGVQIHQSYVVSINCSHIMRISFAIVMAEKFPRILFLVLKRRNEIFSATFAKFPFLINQRKSEFFSSHKKRAHERKIFFIKSKGKGFRFVRGRAKKLRRRRASLEPQNENKEPNENVIINFRMAVEAKHVFGKITIGYASS